MVDAVNTRSYPRVAVEALVKVVGADREYAFRTRDLSLGGLFLYTRIGGTYPFRVGTTLDLELLGEDSAVCFRVVIARLVEDGSEEAKDYPTGFAVKIVSIDDLNRERLAALISQAE